jgi:cytochrome c peroxidase
LSPTDRARVELGQRLFFDRALSSDGTVSCASCHVPAEGGDDGRVVAQGIDEQLGARNSPTVLNVGFKELLFWDGRATSLEEQALMPLFAPDEMAADEGGVLTYLDGDPIYSELRDRAFPGRSFDLDLVASALASYERALAAPSRVDEFLLGDEGALSEQERRGLDFFRGNCAFCHDGPGIGGRRFEKLGDEVEWPEARSEDAGLFERTKDDGDRMVFVVPQLRNVSRTAPYFHDGSVETLEEAVELMGRHQLGEELAPEDVEDVVAFLRALEGDPEEALRVDPFAR